MQAWARWVSGEAGGYSGGSRAAPQAGCSFCTLPWLRRPSCVLPLRDAHLHCPGVLLLLTCTADLYDVIKHHRERQSAMLPHVFKSAMYQLLAGGWVDG
jgi:hypothetical protein